MTAIEPQDELKEELNKVIEQPEEPQGETDEVENTVSDPELPKFDPNDPVFKAGSKHMQEAMQKAMDKRIAKEVAKRKAIENQFELISKRLEAVEKVNVPPKPKLSEFNTEEEYDQAILKWHSGSKASPAKVIEPDNSPEAMKYTQAELEYSKNHPEYYEDLNNVLPFLNDDLRSCLYEAGPAVTHYLANNIEMADQISRLSPAKMGRALGLIELSYKKNPPLPKKAEPKPEPAQELRGNTSGVKDISKMTQAEYNKYMSTI